MIGRDVGFLSDPIGHEGLPEETFKMKKSLLATVAALALMTATGTASAAEGARDHGGMNAGSHGDMNRAADSKGGGALKGTSETTGAAANGQEEPKVQSKDGAQSGPSPDSNEVKHDIAPKAGSRSDADTAKSNTSASDKARPSNARSSTTGQGSAQTGQGPAEKTPATRSSDSEKAAPAAKSATDEKSGAGSKTSAQDESRTSAGGSVSLNSEQKTKIRTTVLHASGAPKVSRSSINFNIRVGTVVPRTVHFVAVPETIVDIHPAWRGYRYFVVDEEIIIIEPSSFKIVAILTV
jgi:hypothetical protein